VNRQAGLLRSVCLFGLVAFLVLLGVLIFLSREGGIPFFSSTGLRKSSFALALEEYDQKIRDNPDFSFRQRNSLLDLLEKKALDTENTLSVLKRRRNLAFQASVDQEQYRSAYIQAAARARRQYPYSGQVGALAAEALILDGRIPAGSAGPAAETAADELQELAVLMSQGGLTDLSLAFSVYSGGMGDPALARALPRELFTRVCSRFQGEEREKYLVNSCIRTLLEKNTQEAADMINGIFEEPPLRGETFLFGAEFFYDHGNFLRSAELFSAFDDSRNLARQADSLWLAGFAGSARGLWQAAAAANRNAGGTPGSQGTPFMEGTDLPSIRSRSFYNLASTAPNPQEAGRWLEELFAAQADYQPGRIFGIIRYSRLVSADRALAILSQTDYEQEGLFDLELLRRRSEDWEIDKTVAETWMLLNRHSQDERLFEWAVWYFDFQRRYDETALALRNAGMNRVEGPWSALHRAFALVREKQFTEAEKFLRSIVRSPQETKNAPGRRTQPLWQAGANLAWLLEKQRNYQEALQYYEIAAGQLAGFFGHGEPAGQTEPSGQADLFEQAGAQIGPPGQTRPAAPPRVFAGIPAAGVVPERRDAARIQVRIAGVLRSLGKTPESARALDYALDLDPENLEARLERRRLDAGRSIL
jgi:tetratricopeptide (TPR) repeat protein